MRTAVVVMFLCCIGIMDAPGVCGGVDIPIEIVESPVAEAYATFMTQGAPVDSTVLRVSLFAPVDRRCVVNAYIVVEELRWPPPPPQIEFVKPDSLLSRMERDFKKSHEGEKPWFYRATRIPGGFLNKERKAASVIVTADQAKYGGEFWSHVAHPYEFVAWLSPTKFVVEDGRGRYTIERVEPGRFELVEVIRTK